MKPCIYSVFALAATACVPAHAQPTYPVKPIRLLVGFAAGGPSDVGARTIAQKLNEKWGQPVIVDFRPGAAGNIATEMLAKSPADGYTLIAAAFAHAVNPSLYGKLPFNAEKDFAPVLMFASIANLLVARERFYSIGAEPLANTPEEFATFIQNEMTKWAKVVKAAGIKVE